MLTVLNLKFFLKKVSPSPVINLVTDLRPTRFAAFPILFLPHAKAVHRPLAIFLFS